MMRPFTGAAAPSGYWPGDRARHPTGSPGTRASDRARWRGPDPASLGPWRHSHLGQLELVRAGPDERAGADRLVAIHRHENRAAGLEHVDLGVVQLFAVFRLNLEVSPDPLEVEIAKGGAVAGRIGDDVDVGHQHGRVEHRGLLESGGGLPAGQIEAIVAAVTITVSAYHDCNQYSFAPPPPPGTGA